MKENYYFSAMCYANSLTSKNVDLKKKYKKKIPLEIADEKLFHASAFTYPFWKIITANDEIEMMRWGLIPNWYAGNNYNDFARNTFNARAETIAEKASFKNLIDTQRCIVPSTGFFEYQANGKEKKPFFVFPKNEMLFSMAGLYDTYMESETGTIIQSFTIVTCEANSLMAEIHNTKKRMPLLLDETGVSNWLNELDLDKKWLAPTPSEWMQAIPINPKIINGQEHNTNKVQLLYNPPTYEQGKLEF